MEEHYKVKMKFYEAHEASLRDETQEIIVFVWNNTCTAFLAERP
jgi:hypothetical protein